MFVDIKDFKSALAVENILTPYKKGRLSQDKKTRLPKEHITPDVCMEVLKSTNYARNIKDMLLCIAELPAHEQAQFKDVILAVFDNREQPKEVMNLGKKLLGYSADDRDFELEYGHGLVYFLSAAERMWCACVHDGLSERPLPPHDKWIFLTHADMKINPTFQDPADLVVEVPPLVEVPNSEKISFASCDIHKLRKVQTKESATVSFVGAKNYPQELDVSGCAEVCVPYDDATMFQNWKYKPDALTFVAHLQDFYGPKDFTGFGGVKLLGCSFAGKESDKWGFPEGCKVLVSDIKLQGDMFDFSKCREVEIDKCMCSDGYQFKFAKGAKVHFSNMRDMQDMQAWDAAIDVSQCSEVKFCDCYLPAGLDLSCCSDLDLAWCNLAKQPNLVFAKGAKVDLSFAYNLPEVLDVSMCQSVKLLGTKFAKVKYFIVASNMEIDMGAGAPDDLKKKIVYWDKLSPQKKSAFVKKYPEQLKQKAAEMAETSSHEHVKDNGLARLWGKIWGDKGR